MSNKEAPIASFTECYCHNTTFNPTQGAKVMGGPAPIPLAQIGVKIMPDGTLAFTSDFNGPIGPQV
jgi:Rieske Fe-S protein